jgi:hypothetical protein
MAKRRAQPKLRHGDALRATRVFVKDAKLVYIILADKKLKYPKGKSRIAYIGTTKKGGSRVAASAAERGEQVLGLHGVREFTVRVLSARPRQRVKIWYKLEHALLWSFKQRFGRVPKCNSTKKTKTESDAFKYFHKAGVASKIEDLS